VSVVQDVDRILHCTPYTDHLNYNYRSDEAKSACTRLTTSDASETQKATPGFLLT